LLELWVRDVVEFHRARGGLATIVLRPAPDAARWGLIEIDADDRVRRVVGLPPGPIEASLRAFMFPGLHVFEPGVFRYMDAGASFGVIRETYPRLLRAGERVHGFVTGARWITIDTPETLAAAGGTISRPPFRFCEEMRKHRLQTCYPSKTHPAARSGAKVVVHAGVGEETEEKESAGEG